MTELRGKDYVLRVGTLEITGLDIRFEIVKSTKAKEPNSASISIWNLSADSRKAIEALSLKPKKDGLQTGQIRAELEAGYLTTGRSLLFRGDLRTAVSKRDGPNIVTTLEGEDGGRSVLSARVSESFPPGTDLATVVRVCARAMGVGLGNLADVTSSIRATFPNGVVLSGPAPAALTNALRGLRLTYSVQNGVLQLQSAGEPLRTQAVLLRPPSEGRAGTGLVGSPERDANGIVTATTLLIPDVIVGGKVVFDAKDLRGAYQIKKLTHTGDTFGNEWYHKLECKEY